MKKQQPIKIHSKIVLVTLADANLNDKIGKNE